MPGMLDLKLLLRSVTLNQVFIILLMCPVHYLQSMKPVKKKLTDKQQAFCIEYMKDFNATQAVIKAGYSEKGAKTMGSQLLANINVASEIKRLQEKAGKKHHITKAVIIDEVLGVIKNMKSEENKYDSKAASVVLKASELLCKMLGFFESQDEGQKQIVALQINVKTKNDD